MATDPICGMTVDESSALCAKREGETFYFLQRTLPAEIPGNSEFRIPNSEFSEAGVQRKVLLSDVSGCGIGRAG